MKLTEQQRLILSAIRALQTPANSVSREDVINYLRAKANQN